ncbi:MAG: hypothetical protein Q4D13_06885 [Erysipelotrichaceae bacterium]|nr:hypothetical protein [Erysipelotrichaceae bacterium]
MKKMLTVNYWVMSMAWSMCLNEMNAGALILALCSTIVLSTLRKGINLWRVIAYSLLSMIIMLPVYYLGNIHYFFPSLYLFLIMASINSGLVNEYLCMYKNRFMFPFVLTIIMGILMSTVVILLLPAENYSLFSKQSLLIMVGYIFLPYLVRPLCCMFGRMMKRKYIEAYGVWAAGK